MNDHYKQENIFAGAEGCCRDTSKSNPVPQLRIIEKMDEYMSRRDYAGAERHLLYWLEEARLGHDLRGELVLRNELIGHYRKTADQEKALENIDAALTLLENPEFEGTQIIGTTCINAATACNAFGYHNRALHLFERARAVYEGSSLTDPQQLAGLYNNMGLTCASLEDYDRADALYHAALRTLQPVPDGNLEQAITYLNMADLVNAKTGSVDGEREIQDCLDQAMELLDQDPERQDGYYAFVCEKCAPAFSYYGYFAAANLLNRRAQRIYTRQQNR
ncbi:MAG: hypothetical protein IJI10_12865 [Eubacterium sp.]|nr:hypothetical protein [Eubacterium sp.]